jgi:hypothetical protein
MNNNYYDRLFKKILNETLEEKANSLVKTLKLNKDSEFDYVQEDDDDFLDMGKFNKYRRDTEYKSKKDARRMADRDMSKHFKSPGDPWATDVNPSEKWPKHKLPYDTKFNFDELSEGAEVCNECGLGMMTEGECNECGYRKMSMKESKEKCNECGMGTMKEGECNECGYRKMSMEESKKLSTGQKHIARQAKPYDKIGANDFQKLRSKKTETKEGKKFPDLTGDGKVTRADILKGRGVELGKKKPKVEETVYRIYSGKESAVFTENEVIDMIEQFVNEEKQKFKKGQTPAGYVAYEKAVKQSKKNNDDYINSVLKKIKDYTKPGSETTYEMNPEGFPQGNGEFKESEKKAYSTSEEGTDWNYKYAGQMVPDFDPPFPDKKRFKKQIEGSAENANVQGWGNSVKTKANSKFAKIFDEDPLGKAKDETYKRAEQPVTLSKGKLKEDFDRIKELMKYNDKTQ